MKKLKTKNMVASLLCLACIGGGAVGLSYALDSNKESTKETTDNVGFDVVKNDGIRIKMLNSSVDEMSGHVIKTIGYTITPSDAKYNMVSFTIEYASGMSVPTEIMEVTHDPEAKTFSFICKQAFSEQIIFKVYSYYDSTISASMTIDYEKKLLGVSFDQMELDPSLQQVTSSGNTYDYDLTDHATPFYSAFTIDKEINLTFKDFYVGQYNVNGGFYQDLSTNMGADEIFRNIGQYVASSITENGVIPKVNDKAIYDIIATNQEIEFKFVQLSQYLNSLGGPDQDYDVEQMNIEYQFSGSINDIPTTFNLKFAPHNLDFTKYASIITNVSLEVENLLF